MSMKEHKSELQQKVITLEHALNQARYELSERAVEVCIGVQVVMFYHDYNKWMREVLHFNDCDCDDGLMVAFY